MDILKESRPERCVSSEFSSEILCCCLVFIYSRFVLIRVIFFLIFDEILTQRREVSLRFLRIFAGFFQICRDSLRFFSCPNCAERHAVVSDSGRCGQRFSEIRQDSLGFSRARPRIPVSYSVAGLYFRRGRGRIADASDCFGILRDGSH